MGKKRPSAISTLREIANVVESHIQVPPELVGRELAALREAKVVKSNEAKPPSKKAIKPAKSYPGASGQVTIRRPPVVSQHPKTRSKLWIPKLPLDPEKFEELQQGLKSNEVRTGNAGPQKVIRKKKSES